MRGNIFSHVISQFFSNLDGSFTGMLNIELLV